MSNYFSKISLFSLSEKINIIKFTIGSRLINNVPRGIKNSYLLCNRLLSKGIQITSKNETITFNYPINNQKTIIQLKRNSSDAQVFEQIVELEEYKSLIEVFKKNNIVPRNMIDVGANIGLTCLYFRAHFPELNIVALEPSDDTFNRLSNNISNNNFGSIHLLKKGLWSSKKRLKADTTFRDGQDWSFRLIEAKPDEEALFETTTIDELIHDFNIETIDFLKIDIEGGEVEVFKEFDSIEWLPKIKIIALEIHDEFNCREYIEFNLEKYFELSHTGELTIGVNKNLK